MMQIYNNNYNLANIIIYDNCAACEPPSYLDRRSNSCVRQCPLFFFGNHTTGLCQPCKLPEFIIIVSDNIIIFFFLAVPDVLPNGVQADATAYFGRILTNATVGTPVFPFRIIIDPSTYGGDLDAIITILNRDNQVARTFRFGDNGQTTRPFTFIGGINAENAAGLLPPEIRVLENRLVVLEDSVIYTSQDLGSTDPLILDFDLSIIVVGRGPGARTNQTNFGIGRVALIPPSQGVYIIS